MPYSVSNPTYLLLPPAPLPLLPHPGPLQPPGASLFPASGTCTCGLAAYHLPQHTPPFYLPFFSLLLPGLFPLCCEADMEQKKKAYILVIFSCIISVTWWFFSFMPSCVPFWTAMPGRSLYCLQHFLCSHSNFWDDGGVLRFLPASGQPLPLPPGKATHPTCQAETERTRRMIFGRSAGGTLPTCHCVAPLAVTMTRPFYVCSFGGLPEPCALPFPPAFLPLFKTLKQGHTLARTVAGTDSTFRSSPFSPMYLQVLAGQTSPLDLPLPAFPNLPHLYYSVLVILISGRDIWDFLFSVSPVYPCLWLPDILSLAPHTSAVTPYYLPSCVACLPCSDGPLLNSICKPGWWRTCETDLSLFTHTT